MIFYNLLLSEDFTKKGHCLLKLGVDVAPREKSSLTVPGNGNVSNADRRQEGFWLIDHPHLLGNIVGGTAVLFALSDGVLDLGGSHSLSPFVDDVKFDGDRLVHESP